MAAGVFMAVDPRHRKRLAPGLRNVLESLRLDFGEHVGVDADIGDADLRPQCIRPGSSRCAGLRRKNVTVSVALMAMPITAPVVPLTPLGRSTLRTGAPLALIASIIVVGLRP